MTTTNISKMETKPAMCVCGDSEDMHVDGVEQCFDIECGCLAFEDKEEENGN